MVPIGNAEPDGWLAVIVAIEQLSVAVSGKLTSAEHAPASATTVISDKFPIVGGVLSITVIVCVAVEVFPTLSLPL